MKILRKIKEWFSAVKELKRLNGLVENQAAMLSYKEAHLKVKYAECGKLDNRVEELEQLVEDAYEEGAFQGNIGVACWHKSNSKLRRSGGVPTTRELWSMDPSYEPYPDPDRIAKVAPLVPKPPKAQISVEVPQPA